jgi:hypothetical protein
VPASGAPASGAPHPGPYGAPHPGPYGAPVAPPKKSSGTKIALIIGAVVLVLLCGCGGVGVWAYNKYSADGPAPAPTPTATDSPNPEPSDSAEPSDSPSPSDDDSSVSFKKGDCVVNQGTDSDAQLKKVPCGPNTYEVLSRIPFTSDKEKCKTDPLFGNKSTDTTYTHDDPRNITDFVLCMKKRTR